MPRKPNEQLSQRELTLRYRILLDEAMRVPPDSRRIARSSKARERILQLARENPKATYSSHVLWNIGKRRCAWLMQLLEEEPTWPTPSITPDLVEPSKRGETATTPKPSRFQSWSTAKVQR